MKRPLFTGLCTALVTPFAEDQVNYEMLEMLMERQIGAGVDAIVLTGTTGESPTLTREEKLEIYRRGVETAAGRCKILAGTGSNSTANAVALSREAAELGVDGLLVVTPYYNKATQPGLVKHYRTICESVDIPVLAYNVPSRTGVDILPQTALALAELPNLVGIKEASGDIVRVSRLCDAIPVYTGNDDQTVATMALGGCGVISVVSNVLPELTLAMVRAAQRGDYPTAASLQQNLLPLMDLMFCQVNPIPVKAAMRIIGYDCGDCRMPLDGLTAENREKLRRCLNGNV
ncbi:MAG: 4-hydroxy-tetrahydrodipicolinate synthase [Oscillospiraceae bacterium]|nr:4-hydroxy-tetrahydrodipicolinate synthase [Oscillospiraceae bacterium]